MDMELRRIIRAFVRWQIGKGMLGNVIDYEMTEQYLEEVKYDVNEFTKSTNTTKKLSNDLCPVVSNCPLCGGETTFLEPDKCMTTDCSNCIF